MLDYQKLLNELEKSKPDNHLLLGNGFNNSLGVKTSYSEIFSQMIKNYSKYKNLEKIIKKEGYDIEKLIGHLKKQVKSNGENFLPNYIRNKVKLDFMEATNAIVQKNIKEVYRKNNQEIHLLFKKFTNYFTLNYDPLLYLLLLKFKKDKDNTAIAFQNTSLYIQESLDAQQNQIYTEIKEARERGEVKFTLDENSQDIPLKKVDKQLFYNSIKNFFKDRGWKSKNIKIVCDEIWKEEKNTPILDVNDGFKDEFFATGEGQNLYFLHGAFHLTKNGKITAKQNKAFLEKLEEVIASENQDIICVLAHKSDEKKEEIEKNPYLNKCFSTLAELSGSLVILGSSLAENDQHIFDKINSSSISRIYVSVYQDEEEKYQNYARELFKEKEIIFFDSETISYNIKNNDKRN